MYTQEMVEELFKVRKVLRVTFLKKDRTERTMICTRELERIPVEHHPKQLAVGESRPAKPPGLLNVYELGAGWKSFYCDKIIRIDAVEDIRKELERCR